jgi:hypothetical protein
MKILYMASIYGLVTEIRKKQIIFTAVLRRNRCKIIYKKNLQRFL